MELVVVTAALVGTAATISQLVEEFMILLQILFWVDLLVDLREVAEWAGLGAVLSVSWFQEQQPSAER
jgi:hypothetical protein